MNFKHTKLIIAASCLQVAITWGDSNSQTSTSVANSNATAANNGQQQGFSFNYSPVTTADYPRTIFPVVGPLLQGNFPQVFNDPGVAANAMADPLIWYYLDALASPCASAPELKVSEDKWVKISYQPDCGLDLAVRDNSPLGVCRSYGLIKNNEL